MKVLFDSNILIDYLNGVALARDEINSSYSTKLISRISWIEVMVGIPQEHEESVRRFLNRFTCIDPNPFIAQLAVNIRRQYRMRLPDAVIWATAHQQEAMLITRNSKDFPAQEPGIRIPYQL